IRDFHVTGVQTCALPILKCYLCEILNNTMNTILKKATIIDSRSKYHNQVVDIKIEKGIITEIAKSIKAEKSFEVIEHDNLYVSRSEERRVGKECRYQW